MEFTEYKRGVLGMKNPDGTSFGFLPETKESCITDDNGISLTDKIVDLQDSTSEHLSDKNNPHKVTLSQLGITATANGKS